MRKCLLYFCAYCLLFSSCSPRVITPTKITLEKDSVSVITSEQVRDTAISVEGDQTELEIPLLVTATDTHSFTIKNFSQTKKSKRSSVKAEVSNNVLTITSTCDSLLYLVELKDRTISSLRYKSKDTSETKVVQVKYIPKVVKAFAWLGGLFVLLTTIKIYMKFIKPI